VARDAPVSRPWRPWIAGIYGHDASGVRLLHNLFFGDGYGVYFRKMTDRKGGAARLTATGNLFVGERLIPVCLPADNPPAVEKNLFEANVYPESGRPARFAVTGWSRDGKAGIDQTGVERILAAGGGAAGAPPRFGDPAKPAEGYILTLDQWRTLTGFDRHSVAASVTARWDRGTWTLTLTVPESALHLAPPPDPALSRDFLGQPIASPPRAGPFADLAPGTRTFRLQPPVALP